MGAWPKFRLTNIFIQPRKPNGGNGVLRKLSSGMHGNVLAKNTSVHFTMYSWANVGFN